jgi:hypothetical protein
MEVAGGRGFESHCEYSFFVCNYINLGFQRESMWTPALVLTGLNQDSLNSVLPDGVYQDSRWSIDGV